MESDEVKNELIKSKMKKFFITTVLPVLGIGLIIIIFVGMIIGPMVGFSASATSAPSSSTVASGSSTPGTITPGGGSTTTSSTNRYNGTFTSDITGKTFYLIIQNDVYFPLQCNRAAGATILSGYVDVNDAISKGENNGSGFPYGNSNMFAGTGFTITNLTSSKSNYIDIISLGLQQGKYYMFRFDNTTVLDDVKFSGTNGHWISVLGYKVEAGVEKIFIGDSGYGNAGWYNINIFSPVINTTMDYFYQLDPP